MLVLTGDAGIGKTELLDDAATFATGMRLLRSTGSESESEVPFAGLLQLLRPALVHLERIPSPQADALASALALRPATGAGRFAIGAATLSLLSRYAEDAPVAVLIDDAHLLDVPSAQAITFAARRLTADPVVLLAAVREGMPSAFTQSDLPVLRIGGLSLAAARELLVVTGHTFGDTSVARLHDVTAGNPLALVELADDAARVDAVPPRAPIPVPASLARTFASRADQLSEAARTAMRVAAAGGGDLDLVARACRVLNIDVSALEEAENGGLLRVAADEVIFRHPLVSSAVFADAPPGVRRLVHRALAAALPADDADRRAWHLGEAALGPDDEIAHIVERAAARAQGRGAYAVAAGAFERAARLSIDPTSRAERLVSAGESAWQAGMNEYATSLLAEAGALRPALALSVKAAGLRGAIAARSGSVEDARDLLMAAGNDIADTDADTAIMLFADAILSCFFLGDTSTVLRASNAIDVVTDRALTGRARLVGAVGAGVAGVLTGRGGGAERIRSAVQEITPEPDLLEDPRVAPWLVLGPLFLRESATGRALVHTVVEKLRERTAVGGLPFLLFHVARDQATTERWDLAELNYCEGIHLAREAGQTSDLAACLAGLSWLEARQGRDARCREHANEALRICTSRHIALFQAWSLFAVGELELGLGNLDAAVVHLDRLDSFLTDLGLVDVDLSPAPELVDALVGLGQHEVAREAALRYAERAVNKGQPWALARAERAVAMTSPDEELDERFGCALDHHASTLDTFELARTQLAYGARLRRARRRIDARPRLRASLATFETLGAAPWAERAAGELRATGETTQRRGASVIDQLTAQELQVARLLSAGRTTREAAAALFLSPKTVEYHLRHVYIKLGIGSRGELTSALSGGGK